MANIQIREVGAQFRRKIDSKQNALATYTALMGRGDGTNPSIPGREGYVWVRVGHVQSLMMAYNTRIGPRDDLPIYVGYLSEQPSLLQVISIRQTAYAESGQGALADIATHHINHEYGGGDDVYVDFRRILGFRVGRPAAFTVTVDSGVMMRGGTRYVIAEQTLNLAALQPAAGTDACYVLIKLDANGIATAVAGANQLSINVLRLEHCPVEAAGEMALAAVRLYVSQTEIGDAPTNPDIVDLRFPQAQAAGPTLPAQHDILSAYHGDTLASAVSRGSLIVGNATPKWGELVIGAAGTVLLSDGADAGWGANPGWQLLGNAGTNPAINFVGTSDAQDLVFAVNSAEIFRIDQSREHVNFGAAETAEVTGASVNLIGDARAYGLVVWQHGTNTANVSGWRSRGTKAAPTKALSGDTLFRLSARAYFSDGGANFGWEGASSVRIDEAASEDHTNIAYGTAIKFYTTPIGSVTIAQHAQVDSTGIISAAKLFTNTTGSIEITAGKTFKVEDDMTILPTGAANTNVLAYDTGDGKWKPAAATPGGSAWLLVGNAGTNPAVNFIGTTDVQPFVIRTNGKISGYIASSGGGVDGGARGPYAIEFMTNRVNATEVASGNMATLVGGAQNTVSGHIGTCVGGVGNVVSAVSATVIGGGVNTADGIYSFVAGRRANTNGKDGAWVWGDYNDFDFFASANNEFAARATGGVRFVTAIDGAGATTYQATIDTTAIITSKKIGAAGIALDPNAATGDFALSLSPANLTANRRVTFPNADGTAAFGTGTATRLAVWSDANTLAAGTVVQPAANVLTLTNAAASTLALAITAGKTLTLTAANDYNLTVPATGTAALLGTANIFTAVQTINNGTANTVADPFGVVATLVGATQITNGSTLSIASNDAMAADTGGIIGFGGRYVAAGTGYACWAKIAGFKADATSGNYGGYLAFYTRLTGQNNTERMRITDVGNVKIAGTAIRATTEGTNHLDIFNGTAPVGTLTNGISIYSAAGECWIMDAAGNATQQTPHNSRGEWVFLSKNTVTGKVLRIDMERMMRALNAQFGWDFIQEYVESM